MNSRFSNQNYLNGDQDICDCPHIEKLDNCFVTDIIKPTREKTCGANNDSLEEEVMNLNIQLENLQETITDIEKSHIQCYNSLTYNYDVLSINYKQMSDNIIEIKKDNSDIRCTKNSKIQKETEMVKLIEELQFFMKKNVECNENLQNKNQKEKECIESLERQLCDLERLTSCKKMEVDKLCCKSADVEKTICGENIKLQQIQRRNAEYDQTIKELTTVCREQEAKLSGLKETGPVKLTEANQSTETADIELADLCAMASDWKAKCEHAEEEHRELQANFCEEMSQAKTLLNNLGRDHDRLTSQLSETSSRLAAALCDNKKLLACVKTKATQLEVLKTERDRLKQLAYQNRSLRAVQQAKIDVETKLIEDQKTINHLRLVAIDNEVVALKQASNQREQMIKNARNELNECLKNRPIHLSPI